MSQINTKLDSGLATFTFEDNDGHVFSRFRINPTDVRLAKRAEEFSQYFESFTTDFETLGELAAKEEELGEKINEFLGYSSYEDIFGEVGPFTILPDGSFFVEHVLERLTTAIEPLIAERQAKMQANVDKYTKKYKKKQP